MGNIKKKGEHNTIFKGRPSHWGKVYLLTRVLLRTKLNTAYNPNRSYPLDNIGPIAARYIRRLLTMVGMV